MELRDYLRGIDHLYADGHRYGNGPNWRLRTTRVALKALGFKEDLLRHGIEREVFICPMASNAMEILSTGNDRPDTSSLLSVREIGAKSVNRWLVPRSERRPEFRHWTNEKIASLLIYPKIKAQISEKQMELFKSVKKA